jgi:hypothetical protein
VVYMHVVHVKFNDFHSRSLKVVENYIFYKGDLELQGNKRIVHIEVFQTYQLPLKLSSTLKSITKE